MSTCCVCIFALWIRCGLSLTLTHVITSILSFLEIILVSICWWKRRVYLITSKICFELEDAIDELWWGFAGSRFSVWEKNFDSTKNSSQIEKCKEWMRCVWLIYIAWVLSNRFTFRGDKTDISLMTRIEGARKFV